MLIFNWLRAGPWTGLPLEGQQRTFSANAPRPKLHGRHIQCCCRNSSRRPSPEPDTAGALAPLGLSPYPPHSALARPSQDGTGAPGLRVSSALPLPDGSLLRGLFSGKGTWQGPHPQLNLGSWHLPLPASVLCADVCPKQLE